MNKIATTVLAATLTMGLAAPAVATPAPGVVGTRTCAYKSDYKKLRKGMTKTKVAYILHNKGKKLSRVEMDGYVAEMRDYRTCSSWSSVIIMFENGRLDTKSAMWVS